MNRPTKNPKTCPACAAEAKMTRRRLIREAAAGMLAGAPLASVIMSCAKPGDKMPGFASAEATSGVSRDPSDRKFLFVFGAMGGASINDSFMAVRQKEPPNGKGLGLNTFPDGLVSEDERVDPRLRLRAVDVKMDAIGPLDYPAIGHQSGFLRKYAPYIAVATVTGNTVSHPVGQFRSITGNDGWNGRTLQEAVAAQYGQGLLMPNVNMATLGFGENGSDPSLPAWALAHQVQDTRYFPFSLHGSKGLRAVPDEALINIAREIRNEKIDPNSNFFQTFKNSPLIQKWLEYRRKTPEIEKMDLINRLTTLEDSDDTPYRKYGLDPNPRGPDYRRVFSNLKFDPLQRQALLAYLLVTEGLTTSVTMGLDMNVSVDTDNEDTQKLTNTPTSFDYSHNAHRATQALLWDRILSTCDRLITLLAATEYKNGTSFWDHSLIYIATEFGREKTRESGVSEFTSGHDTNNGVVMISPLVNGGRVFGGINLENLNTYGFDPETGAPMPGRNMDMRHIYAGILHTLEVDTKGASLPSVRAFRKKA